MTDPSPGLGTPTSKMGIDEPGRYKVGYERGYAHGKRDAEAAALTASPQGEGLRELLTQYTEAPGVGAEHWIEVKRFVDWCATQPTPTLDVGLRADYELLRAFVREHLIAHEKVTEAESTGGPTLIAAWRFQLELSLGNLTRATLAPIEGEETLGVGLPLAPEYQNPVTPESEGRPDA